jgi:hypothetical protein
MFQSLRSCMTAAQGGARNQSEQGEPTAVLLFAPLPSWYPEASGFGAYVLLSHADAPYGAPFTSAMCAACPPNTQARGFLEYNRQPLGYRSKACNTAAFCSVIIVTKLLCLHACITCGCNIQLFLHVRDVLTAAGSLSHMDTQCRHAVSWSTTASRWATGPKLSA